MGGDIPLILALFTLLLWAPPVLPSAEPSQPPSTAEGRLVEAEAFYRNGSTLYKTADYSGAIEKFTAALGLIGDAADGQAIKLALLYNIARAHEMAYELDREIVHLRQALELYKRYEQEQRSLGDQLDAGARGAAVEAKLQRLEIEAQREPEPPPKFPPLEEHPSWARSYRIGVGLLVPGVASLISGFTILGLGSTYGSRAKVQVEKLSDLEVPPESPAWAQGDEFIAQERRKGRIVMAVGGSLVGVGAVLVGVGAYYTAKGRRERVRVSPTMGTFGMSFSGRF